MGGSSGHRETPSIAIVLYDCQKLFSKSRSNMAVVYAWIV
eukprot:COSAG02_NODE_12795_length_1491_cov_153.955460_2_plen_39_part_01